VTQSQPPTSRFSVAQDGDFAPGAFLIPSAWLMCANLVNGILMFLVHPLARWIPPGEYGLFGTLLAVTLFVPMLPVQMVMAQQTAQAVATGRLAELAGVARSMWLAAAAVCLGGAVAVFAFEGQISTSWGLSNPVLLWVTVLAVALSLWLPMSLGMLQGQQRFGWLGWTLVVNGGGRLVTAAIAVLVLGSHATGMMAGVVLGLAAATAVASWQTVPLWARPPARFDRRVVVAQIVPLMVGAAAFQFILMADTLFVRSYFGAEETGFYVAAGTMARALLWVAMPLATVMFPKVVRTHVVGKPSNLTRGVLLGSGVLAAAGATVLWLFGPWIVGGLYGDEYVRITSAIVPWYAWAMVPLTLANVLLNDVMARSLFLVVPLLLALALAYAVALLSFHDSLVSVLRTMGVFNVLLLAVCACFSRAGARP
jgi:O-antigen/teichoic acid export membrane protein